ncbi:flagellar assembly protein T N-terminal domain-containing protein [Marinobacter sp. V034]|uniref:flagellar assembly protein T N-terminal domain-containing protein n=1 Tax=Marinobacter sp. V034 TaxID=3459610 RepID=UPI0040441C1B
MAVAKRWLGGCLVWICVCFAGTASAEWVQGTGQAVIVGDDIQAARDDARTSALRDAALQYEATINSQDTMENGVLTDSRLTVASRARAKQVRILEEQRRGNILRLTIEADMSVAQHCEARDAARMRKRVAITGFPVLHPEQTSVGEIGDAGEVLPEKLRQRVVADGGMEVLSASRLQMFPEPLNAPTSQRFDNSLTNIIELARELDAQFVVTGVIRDLSLSDPRAWGASVTDRMKRSMGMTNRNREFVADLMVYDGFSGSPVYRQRFTATGEWDVDSTEVTGFGSAAFRQSGYGQAVGEALDKMGQAIQSAIACQPFITRITRVDGQAVYLASGATSGLRPGDELQLYRSFRFFDAPDATPELRDAKATMTVNNVHPDFSNGLIMTEGGQLNLQRDDIAIMW